MEYRSVFLLGRPGSGKSSLYHELRKRILESGRARTVERIDDFPKLWSSFQRDDALEREGKERIYSSRTADGHYLIA
jgi:DNA replication protein DnaC